MAGRIPQEERRRQILGAATEVFARHGFYEAKIEDVALAAGIGKGTIYEYFRSKAELFRAMLEYVGEYHVQVLRANMEACGSAGEKLAALARAHLDLLLQHRDLARLIFYSHAVLGESVWQWMEKQEETLLELLAGIVREGVAQREFRPVDAALAARAFLGALWSTGGSLICRGGSPQNAPDTAEIAAELAGLFRRGLARF